MTVHTRRRTRAATVADETSPDTALHQRGQPARPMVASQLDVPLPSPGLVDRPRLVRLLEQGASGPVTLLAAPAGWGKTSLLSAWVGGGRPRTAWLTLEDGDVGDRFWSYLRAAVLTADRRPGQGQHRSLARESVPGTVPAEVFLATLANALATLPDPVTVVLDDFHKVTDPGVGKGLDFLLRRAAGRLRLVIATREALEFSVHRWRLDGELIELTAAELSFRPAEVAGLLARLGQVLPADRLAALAARTEGWPAGLRLAGLAMRDVPDPARFVDQFTGDDRTVADYLTAEVLSRQPPDVREMLLHTAVLERLSGTLADVLTGRTDGARVLLGLERANAFLIADGTGQDGWYRHHHLFGDLLNAELRRREPERVTELHRRAAGWLAVHGQPADALRHTLAARDWGYAVELMSGHWSELVLCGRGETWRTAPAPPPSEALRRDPELALACAADRLDRYDLHRAGDYLRLADGHAEPLVGERRTRFAAMAAALRLAHALRAGDPAATLDAADAMLALLPPGPDTGPGSRPAGLDDTARAVALAARGAALLAAGDAEGGERVLSAGLAAAERAGAACATLACTSHLALLRALRGELDAAAAGAGAALALPPCRGRCAAAHSARAYLALAIVGYERDDLDGARRHLDLATRCRERDAEPAVVGVAAMVAAWLLQVDGDLTRAYEELAAARHELAGRPSPPFLDEWMTTVEAELRTSCGDTGTARELVGSAPPAGTCRPSVARAVALARTYLRDGDPGTAARTLPEWSDSAAAGPFLTPRLEAGLVEVLAARELGDHRRASRALERVLELAAPEGFRRVLSHGGQPVRELLREHLDAGTAYWPEASELIAAIGEPPAADSALPPALAEPLTERELTVLRYLQGTLSHTEIAADLSLSLNTVKTHVRNIYRKLRAGRRRDAVRVARDLQLL